jgi:hypothetical protein
LPDGELKTELDATVDVYTDAIITWSDADIQGYWWSTASWPGKTLIPKYSLPSIYDAELHQYRTHADGGTRAIIWSYAAAHIEAASKLLK